MAALRGGAEISPADLVVVVRTAGERTLAACRLLLTPQIGKAHLHVVQERPFEAALRSTYRIGIASEATWMMTLDADVLLRDGAVADLLAAARRLPTRVVQLEGMVHDKFLGDYRAAGHRIYRVQHLAKALTCVPADGAEIRPEHATLLRLKGLGHPSKATTIVVGIHDHEQFFADVYRKAFLHGKKHRGWLSSVVPWWQSLADGDPDYRVALRGFFDAFVEPGRAGIDASRQASIAETRVSELRLVEKGDLSATVISEGIRTLLARLETDDLVRSPSARHVRMREAYRRLGVGRFLPYALGSLLAKVGDRLKSVADQERP